MSNKYTYTAPCGKETLLVLYTSGMTQNEIAVHLGTTQKVIWNAMRRFKIKARIARKRNQFGEKNSNWKGCKAGVVAFHRRLYSRFGKPSFCSICGTKGAAHYDYANLTGRYEDLLDYASMCRSCHWKYDKKILNIYSMKEKLANVAR